MKYLSFQATFIFSLINACPCPSLCRFRSGHNLGKNKSCLKWKKTTYYISFLIIKIWQILKRFCRTKTLANISHFWWVCTYVHTCCLKPRCSGYVLLPEKLGFFGYITRRRSATSSSFVQVVNYFQLSLLPISTFSWRSSW